MIPQVTLKDLEHIEDESDILVLLVDHQEFRNHKLNTQKSVKIIDTRGIW